MFTVFLAYHQAAAARELGVTRQAVSKRLIELRGRTTKIVVAKKAGQILNQKLDAVAQLQKINEEANRLLDDLENDPSLKLKIMAEIRGPLKLQLEIFQALYDLRAAAEYQEEVLSAIAEVSPDVRMQIIHRLNEKRAIRSAAVSSWMIMDYNGDLHPGYTQI